MQDYKTYQQENSVIHRNLKYTSFQHTSRKEQNIVHAAVCSLNPVHHNLGVVVAAYVKRSCVFLRVNPVRHFRVVLHHVDGGQW